MNLCQIVLFTLFLVGCTVGPRYCPPEANVPCEWHHPISEENNMNSPAEDFIWWESLNDPVLNCLIKRAALQNLDVQIAASRILETRLETQGKMAQLLPRVDGSANYGHIYYNADTLNDLLCRHQKHCGHRHLNFFEIGFDAEWEFDLFGAKAHEINASKAKIEASEYNFYNIWITLSAEIGKNYIQLRGLQQRLEIIKLHIEIQKEVIHLNQELVRIGTGNAIDLRQAETQLHLLNAQKPPIELAIDKLMYHLSVLLGCTQRNLYEELMIPEGIPSLPCDKPIGIPSELVRRRPDILKAEREFAAATELVGSAVASLFPRLSLRGFVGNITTSLHSLLSSSSFTWFAGPQLLLPIFNSKLVTQSVDYSKIKMQQASFEYQKTVLIALEEADGAIASFHHELERNRSLVAAQESDQETYRLLFQLYEKGMKNYLDVLAAYRPILTTQEMYIQSQVDLLLHYIAIYKAIGGGWDITHCIPGGCN